MQGRIDSESNSQKQIAQDTSDDPSHNPQETPTPVTKNGIAGKNIVHQFSNNSFLKSFTIRMLLLILALSCFTGYSQKAGDSLMGPVFDYDQQYLKKTLVNLSGSLLLISGPKGALEVLKTAEFEPGAATAKAGMIKIGQFVEPYLHIVDDIWDFLVISSYLVVVQMAMIQFSSMISIKYFLGLGALFCAIQYDRRLLFGKIGFTLLFIFFMTYAFYPLTLKLAAKTYEQHQILTSIELSENLGILKEQMKDIDTSFWHLKKTLTNSIPQIVEQGLTTALDATWGLLVGLVLMFIIIPLLIIGTIILIAHRVFIFLDMPEMARNIDSAKDRAVKMVGNRSRKNLTFSGGN